MKHPFVLWLSAAAAIFAAAPAAAEWRCDCTTIVDSCTAEVTVQEAWIDVTSDFEQCARVDYFVDGMPFVAVVVDGQQRQDWISRSADPDVLVRSCQVCRDNALADGTAARASGGAQDAGDLEPLIRVEPSYPEAAAERGLEGFVEVEFEVTEHGLVENARVTESEPADVFDGAALAAIGRWRYAAEPGRAPVERTERLTFEPPARREAAAPSGADARSTERADDVARNQCIREDSVYHYGDVVEVDLINACRDPVALFACAQGTGADAGRWVCGSTPLRQQILVNAADERAGTVERLPVDGNVRDYRYTESFLLARVPNSEYWWLACGESDTDCRSSAESWIRAVDRQSSSIDPRARASLTVARSY